MLGMAIAASSVIGTVTADGAFRLNGDTVMTNGTLTEGAVLETGRGNSSVRLAGGARLFLSADSRGKLYSDRIVLEKGETRLENGVGFHLEALGLTIRPDRGTSTGRIGLLGSKRVRVSALTGSFRVLNTRRVLVANVAAGSAVAFEPQAPTCRDPHHGNSDPTERAFSADGPSHSRDRGSYRSAFGGVRGPSGRRNRRVGHGGDVRDHLHPESLPGDRRRTGSEYNRWCGGPW